MQKVGKVLMALCLITLLTGCQPVDRSLLTGDPCEPPCWQNIIPGVSSEEDVRDLLRKNPFVALWTLECGEYKESDIPVTICGWFPKRRYINDRNRIYLRDGKVLRIEIHHLNYLTLGEIVDKYGPPQCIHAYSGAAEFFYYGVILDYPSRGLSVKSFSLVNPQDIADGTAPLTRDQKVTTAVYYAPAPIEDVLREAFLLPQEVVQSYLANCQEWEGFGRIRLTSWQK